MAEQNRPFNIYTITLPTPFEVGDVNLYIIETETLTLVDAGVKTKEAWKSFQLQLEEYQLNIEDIQHVILTHQHPDHVGLADYFADQAEIYSLPYNIPWLTQDEEFFKHHHDFYKGLYKKMGVEKFYEQAMKKVGGYLAYSCHLNEVTPIEEGSTFSHLPGWKVIKSLGHSQGHISLYHEGENVCIGGDLLIKHISSNALIEPPQVGENKRPKTLLQYRDSLQKLRDLNPEIVYSGHGDPVYNAAELIGERFIKQEERAKHIHSLIKGEPKTAFEISKKLFPSLYLKQLGLTMSEVIGHLDLLEKWEMVSTIEKDGTLHYKAI